MDSQKKRKFDDFEVSEEDKRRSLASMLGPINAEQLRAILTNASIAFPAVFDQVVATANLDPATRKLFVRGLAWETTTAELLAAFSVHGEIEEGSVIMDKMTGKSKGFAFVTFKNITSAHDALAQPDKQIGGRTVSCNLAAMGPVRNKGTMGAPAMGGMAAPQGVGGPGSLDARKLFVRGLSWDTTTETLLKVFGEYGTVEEGAVCMDRATGKSRGFAFVTFATVEGANGALSQEAKLIDGRTTHCNLAAKGKNRNQTIAAPQPISYGMAPQYGYAPQAQYSQAAPTGYAAAPQQQQQYYAAPTAAPVGGYGAPQQMAMPVRQNMGMYGGQRQ